MTSYYPLGETVPVHKAMGGDWAEAVHRTDKRGRRRVVRMVYEVVAFQALRDQLKCKEIRVVGADKWRNPDEDLPQDFAERREENYRELRKPLDAAVFVDERREQMTTELTLLNDEMPRLSWLDIAERKSGAIRLTPADAQPEPKNLRRVKGEVQRRWGIVPLIDMLKEAVLRTGCLDAVTSVSGGGSLSAEVLAERLLLVIYAYGTNTGIKARRLRRPRPHRGRTALRPPPLPVRRGRPRHRHQDSERHLRRPQHRVVGPGLHRGRL